MVKLGIKIGKEEKNKMQNNIIIFDTETIGKVSQNLLNVGYHIAQINENGAYKVLVAKDYLVNEFYYNTTYMLNDDFVGAEKLGLYKYLVDTKQIKLHSLKKIFELMQKDLIKYNVKYGYAYNCAFDIDKFQKESERLNLENPLQNIKVLDIWGFACKYIVDTKEFKKWALNNEKLTATKVYLSSNVETITQYLTDNLEFKETHTALNDSLHELNILSECIKRGCDITKEIKKYLILSNIMQTETLIINNELMEIKFKKKFTRNGKTYYR